MDVVFLMAAVGAATIATVRGPTDPIALVLAALSLAAGVVVWRTRRDVRLAGHDPRADAPWVPWARVGLRAAVVAAIGVALGAQRRAPRSPGVVTATARIPVWGDAGLACPEGTALIPAGTFQMGSTDGVGGPSHAVTLGAFCIDRTEVSVAEYRACVRAGACAVPTAHVRNPLDFNIFCNWGRSDADDHPVNCVDWIQAKAFCEWSANPRGAGRLLREAEWEYAARGAEGRLYPWGDTEPNETLANLCGSECVVFAISGGLPNWRGIPGWTDRFAMTAPVTAFEAGATPEGIRNLAGNVWEWVDDEYVPDAHAQHTSDGHLRVRDASGTSPSTKSRGVRGGGWLDVNAARARPTIRFGYQPTYRFGNVGVRCARGPS